MDCRPKTSGPLLLRSQSMTEGVKKIAAQIIEDVKKRPLAERGLRAAAEVVRDGLTVP
jgi:hypothetical protein